MAHGRTQATSNPLGAALQHAASNLYDAAYADGYGDGYTSAIANAIAHGITLTHVLADPECLACQRLRAAEWNKPDAERPTVPLRGD